MNRALVLLLLLTACAHSAPRPTATPPPAPTPVGALMSDAYEHLHTEPARALPQFEDAWKRGGDRAGEAAYAAASAATLARKPDEAFTWLQRAVDLDTVGRALKQDPDLAPLRGDPRFAAILAREHAAAEARARAVGIDLPRTTPEADGFDPAVLDKLLKRAGETQTSEIVVLHNGKVVVDHTFEGFAPYRIEAMSATKSVVSLAIGILLHDKKIASLDEPLWHFFPEWRQGLKEKITLRMVLNHTSGLAARRDTQEIYRSPNFVQLALAADLSEEPGTFFFYNNEAVNLLTGVVERVTGQKLDVFLGARLFAPLGIHDFTWSHDDAGNPHAMAGLQIYPLDFAKVGQMVLQGGIWKGSVLLDKSFLDESVRSAQPFEPSCGLLWWIQFESVTSDLPVEAEAALRNGGVSPAVLETLRPFYGRTVPSSQLSQAVHSLKMDDMMAYASAMHAAKIEIAHKGERPYGFAAEGFLGQYLTVIPSENLVAVRMVDSTGGDHGDDFEPDDFAARVKALIKR